MKIEQYLIHYLLKYKELSLERIGRFALVAPVPEVSDSSRALLIPDGAINFESDNKAVTEPSLIEFISENTGKIKSLAKSDLDSYLNLCQQFLNIGNPCHIEHIGILQKLPSGEIVYKSGSQLVEKLQSPRKSDREIQVGQEPELFQQKTKTDSRKKMKSALMIFFLAVLVLISWAVWHFIINENNGDSKVVQPADMVVPIPDSMLKGVDTTRELPRDSIKYMVDSITFKVIVDEYKTLAAANRRADTLKSYNRDVVVYTLDSLKYRVAEVSRRPLADTTYIKDSLRIYYGKSNLRLDIPFKP